MIAGNGSRRLFAFALIAATWFVLAPGAAADPNCTCRYAGQSYDLGSCVCIVNSSGARFACCGRVLNNTSWMEADQACPMASTTPAGDKTDGARAVPATTAATRPLPGLAALLE